MYAFVFLRKKLHAVNQTRPKSILRIEMWIRIQKWCHWHNPSQWLRLSAMNHACRCWWPPATTCSPREGLHGLKQKRWPGRRPHDAVIHRKERGPSIAYSSELKYPITLVIRTVKSLKRIEQKIEWNRGSHHPVFSTI